VRFGRQILGLLGNTNSGQTDAVPRSSLDGVSRMFSRFDLQSTQITGALPRDTYDGLDIGDLPESIPSTFTALDEAQIIGKLLALKSSNFRLQKMYFEHSQPAVPPEVLERWEYFLCQMQAYEKAANYLIRNHPAQDWLHPLSRPSRLLVNRVLMQMGLSAGWGRPQTACDNLRPQFEWVISLTREIIRFEKEMGKGIFFTSQKSCERPTNYMPRSFVLSI
jgi:hypothetical protein